MIIFRVRPSRQEPNPSNFEFICLMGFLMALVSFSIDNLLPAFSAIQSDFSVENPNSVQYTLTAYLIGFGLLQLIYGPASDFIGRRPTLMIGLAVFCIGTTIAIYAQSFEWLLIARFIQGMGAAAARVLTDTIIRDRFSGRELGSAISLTMSVFIIAQIIAPVIGQLTLSIGGWRLIFSSMLSIAAIQIFWFSIRMPETLRPEYRFPFTISRIKSGFMTCFRCRTFIGYSTAMALMMGALLGYLGISQSIFVDAYGLGATFPLIFALIAGVMGLGSYFSSVLVRRFGLHLVAHLSICGFVIVSVVQLWISSQYDGHPSLFTFTCMLAVVMLLFSLAVPNFGAIALEPLGSVAGTASAIIGSFNNIIGAAIGSIIGQAYNGTVTPLCLGFLILSILSLVTIFWTSGWRVFQHSPTSLTPQTKSGEVTN